MKQHWVEDRSEFRQWLQAWLPLPVRIVIRMIRASVLPYSEYDPSAYWRFRAGCPGQKAVMWEERYTRLVRERQEQVLRPFVKELRPGARVLDMGCGIGVLSRMITGMRDDITIDAVDFEAEMVKVAAAHVGQERVRYLVGNAEEYFAGVGAYDLILSSASYSQIRDIAKLNSALENGFKMTAERGTMLLMDPFHRWKYLARARVSSQEIVGLASRHGFRLTCSSGMIFWPFRDWLIESNMNDHLLRRRFLLGEKLLSSLGDRYWSDYKILAFQKAPH